MDDVAHPLNTAFDAGHLNLEDNPHRDRGKPKRRNLPHRPGQPANGERHGVHLRIRRYQSDPDQELRDIHNRELEHAPDSDGKGQRGCRRDQRYCHADSHGGEHRRQLQWHHGPRFDRERDRQRHPTGERGVDPAGDRPLVINWTATINTTGYKVQWKTAGQLYNTYGRVATIASGSTTTYTTPNLTNCTEYAVRATATRTGGSDGPASEEATATPTATP